MSSFLSPRPEDGPSLLSSSTSSSSSYGGSARAPDLSWDSSHVTSRSLDTSFDASQELSSSSIFKPESSWIKYRSVVPAPLELAPRASSPPALRSTFSSPTEPSFSTRNSIATASQPLVYGRASPPPPLPLPSRTHSLVELALPSPRPVAPFALSGSNSPASELDPGSPPAVECENGFLFPKTLRMSTSKEVLLSQRELSPRLSAQAETDEVHAALVERALHLLHDTSGEGVVPCSPTTEDRSHFGDAPTPAKAKETSLYGLGIEFVEGNIPPSSLGLRSGSPPLATSFRSYRESLNATLTPQIITSGPASDDTHSMMIPSAALIAALEEHRLSIADSTSSSRKTTESDESPFFYSPPPLQTTFATTPTAEFTIFEDSPVAGKKWPLPPLNALAQPAAQYAFPPRKTFAHLADEVHGPASAPLLTSDNKENIPLFQARPTSLGGQTSSERSFGWLHELYGDYDGEEVELEQPSLTFTDIVSGVTALQEECQSGHHLDPGFPAGWDPSRRGSIVSLEGKFVPRPSHEAEGDFGVGVEMQGVYDALEALAVSRALSPSATDQRSRRSSQVFVTAASTHSRPSPLGSALPETMRHLLAGARTPGEESVYSSSVCSISAPFYSHHPLQSSVNGLEGGADGLAGTAERDLHSELLSSRARVFELEELVRSLQAQVELGQAQQDEMLAVAKRERALTSRLELAEAELERFGGSRAVGIDQVLLELGVDLDQSSALFISPRVAFLDACPHCDLRVEGTTVPPRDETGDLPPSVALEPNLDAWVTDHLACLPHITELLAFVQEPEGELEDGAGISADVGSDGEGEEIELSVRVETASERE